MRAGRPGTDLHGDTPSQARDATRGRATLRTSWVRRVVLGPMLLALALPLSTGAAATGSGWPLTGR